jgi:Mg-chelatase subunit ChlD
VRNRRAAWCLLAVWLIAAPALAQLILSPRPLRIVLLVDSSSEVSAMINPFRAGLKTFLDGLPEGTEVAFITTGGQLRVRMPPTSEMDKLQKAVGGFAPDGGANAFLDTMLEADQRFLKKATDKRHVFVILTTDNGAGRGEPRIDDYNKFLNDFLQRGGLAFGVVVHTGGGGMTATSDIIRNLTSNTNGTYDSINAATAVPDKMKAIAVQLAALP